MEARGEEVKELRNDFKKARHDNRLCIAELLYSNLYMIFINTSKLPKLQDYNEIQKWQK